MKTLKVGVVGLGGRGFNLMEAILLPRENVAVVAVCDLYEDRTQKAADKVKEIKGNEPFATQDYRELLEQDLDAVLVSNSWEHHIPVTLLAMEKGIFAGVEVGGAYSVHELWQLVDTYERTGTPVMLLENCCYGREELMVTRMVREGLFGEIVHGSGGYLHDLREEVAYGRENRHYRLENYRHRNTENYPTHELGPIAQIMDLNYGNRMLTLTATASRAAGMQDYLEQGKGPEDLGNVRFQQGDIVTTVIKCAGGETIVLTLDTTLPRFYSRGFTIRGTRGMYMEDNNSVFLDGVNDADHFGWRDHWNNAKDFAEDYEHPIWKTYLDEGIKGGHGGMDWLVFDAWLEAVEQGTEAPIDVYDMASWMVISTLAEDSVAMGGHPVAIPDFTKGMWMTRRPRDEDKRFKL